MRIADDKYLVAGYFRSLQWDSARRTSAFKYKRKFRDSIREYLHIECGVPENDAESTEIEKAVGRVQLAIRSQWGKKAARTRVRNKELKKKALIRQAKAVIERFVKLKSPLLFGENLPVQMKPSRKVA